VPPLQTSSISSRRTPLETPRRRRAGPRSAPVSWVSRRDTRLLYRAGLVHGFDRLGVSNAIWDRAGSLSAGEWERVRRYPYLVERMVHQSHALAPLGRLAVPHRERMDGSGYPRGLSRSAISRPGPILAAAQAYQTKREPRPHRPACSPDDVASRLRREASAGRLSAEAVDSVLRAAGDWLDGLDGAAGIREPAGANLHRGSAT
jgi:HD-GYP domain-containing protein (c-di-GMP phosphodiesterase class II)